MTDETQGASAPGSDPNVEGADAWAAAFGLHGLDPETAATLATICRRDGYARAVAATIVAAEPAPKPETPLQRLEDEVIRVAEEAAYSVSNLIAVVHNRKPDDGIDAWRRRTGGLHRHAAAKAGA